MLHSNPYPIGTSGCAWAPAEVAQWRARQVHHRSYTSDVLDAIEQHKAAWDVETYGELQYADDRYPLLALRSRHWRTDLPSALITGGVHGYETSGVLGALRFVAQHAAPYKGRVNLVVVPCVSPWSYECIQRWNYNTIDPNRSFHALGEAEEALALMRFIAALQSHFALHMDLHETTDSDETEFAPAKAARDGKVFEPCPIPDGFYLVANTNKLELEFQAAIIKAVAHISPIAAADAQGCLDGTPIAAHGVMNSSLSGICADMTDAPYTTTTEVYPDSLQTTPQECIAAQTVAVCAALDFILNVPRIHPHYSLPGHPQPSHPQPN